MTRTRSQAAKVDDDQPEPRKTNGSKEEGNKNSIVLDFAVAAPSKKISKQPKNVQNSDQLKKGPSAPRSNQNSKPASKGTGMRGRPPKLGNKQNQITIEEDNTDMYNAELVNLNLIKPFDIEAVIDQTGNSNGDSHLPRATLNQIIRESLPCDVRAQRDTMDLICFISNAFIDLLSDVSNNVCYKYKKKNIVPEHVVRGLQYLNLDQYIPYLLTDQQNLSLTELLKAEKKKNAESKGEGVHSLTHKQINNVERSHSNREEVVSLMVKRLSNQALTGVRSQPKKNQKKREWTQKEIDDQRKIFDNFSNNSDDSEMVGEEGTSNNSPSLMNGSPEEGDPSQLIPESAQNSNMYGEDFRASWINHNKALLDQDYLNWAQNLVNQYIEYVNANPTEAENYITDLDKFQEAYPLEYFYELQYQEYLASCEPQQQNDGQIQPSENQPIAVEEDQQDIQENQQAQNGVENAQIDQDQQIVSDQNFLTVENAMATTAEVTNIAQDPFSAFPQPTMTPANSMMDKNANQQLIQATSNAISYSIIKPDQATQQANQTTQKPAKNGQKAKVEEEEVDFDDIDD